MTAEFIQFPRWNPRFVTEMPLRASAPAISHLYAGSRRSALMGLFVLRVLLKSGWSRGSRCVASEIDGPLREATLLAYDVFAERLSDRQWTIVGWLGSSRGSDRKLTFSAYSEQVPLLFAKVSAPGASAARDLVSREVRVLECLAESELEQRVPRLTGVVTAGDLVCMVTEPLVGARIASRSSIDPWRVKFLDALQREGRRGTFAGIWGPDSDTVAAAHGDFTPWNMMVDPERGLQCLDWEYAAPRPLGWDICHHEVQIASYFSRAPSRTAALSALRRLIPVLRQAHAASEEEATAMIDEYCAISVRASQDLPRLHHRAQSVRAGLSSILAARQ